MNVSIVIPTYNRVHLLKQCLRSVLGQKIKKAELEYEVIVALDKRDDKTVQWLYSEYKFENKITIVKASYSGMNAARNRGIQEARGDIIYFLDDDCIPPDQYWINEIVQGFSLYNDAAAIGGCCLLNGNNDLYALCRNTLYNFYLTAHRDEGRKTCALLGGNSGYRKEIFINYGMFDERITYGSTETEMNDRILKSNNKIYFIEKLSVFHLTQQQTFFSYCKKSFRQGIGKAYSSVKNRLAKTTHSGRAKMWFWKIAKTLPVDTKGKVIGGIFLFINSIFYWLGFGMGFLYFLLCKK